MIGAAYKEEAGTLDTLARYETNLERGLARATEQLETRQAARREREYRARQITPDEARAELARRGVTV
jgi:hypothetical protein